MARGSALSSLSFRELQGELVRRRRRVATMVRKHRRLIVKAAQLAEQIRELGGSSNGTASSGRRRPKNKSSLVETLSKVLHGKTMGVAEAAEAVRKAGYRTNSKSFRTVVNISLINSGEFRRVARGQYTAKGL